MILVDDYSKDDTVAVAQRLGLKVFGPKRTTVTAGPRKPVMPKLCVSMAILS
jgi:glycosyltransferase involved in cell wall biosynthesis